MDYLTADVEIPETDVSKLKVGQKVEFSFPAYKQNSIYGYVVSWPAIGEITSRGATIVNAKVRIDEYPKEILPNFSFTGKIQITEPQENLIVERYAIAYENKNAYVELFRTGKKVDVQVQPYGKEYGGEILKAQSEPLQSGWNKRGGSNKNPGAGGPPPGRF